MNQTQRYNLLLSLLLIFQLKPLIAEPFTSFSLKSFNDYKDPNFDTNFVLLGDAHIANEGNLVKLTTPLTKSSFGQIVCQKPFKFVDSKSSFSSEFTFSISDGDGDGIAFVIFPSVWGFSKVFNQGYFGLNGDVESGFVSVMFDTRKGGNNVGLDVGKFVSFENVDVSSIGLMLNGGVFLKSWIDYEASSKRLEIRLAEDGTERPYNPLVAYRVDLSKMWGGGDVLVGISSANKGSKQVSSLSSWSFKIRGVPSSLHSEPLNPEMKFDGVIQPVARKKSCFLTVLGTVIFATGCGTLVAFLALFVWVIMFGRHSNAVLELPMNQVDFKYEKVDVTVDNDSRRYSTG